MDAALDALQELYTKHPRSWRNQIELLDTALNVLDEDSLKAHKINGFKELNQLILQDD
jgi:hypothetical protein